MKYQTKKKLAQQGFTLVELSVVLAVIGLILGAVAIGRDLQRNAAYQRISTDFLQGWLLAYDGFVAGTGIVPGDNASAPTGKVNAGTSELCGTAMVDAFLAAGIRVPEGRAEGQRSHAVYLDSNGNPQDLEVCFQNITWAEAGAAVGNYAQRPRNVMVLKGATPALASMLDSQIDGHPDARFGRVREERLAGSHTVTTGQPWSLDERSAYGSAATTGRDEDQVAVVQAVVQMTR